MSETTPDLRERLRVAAFQNACAKPYPDDGPEMTWAELDELSKLLREAAAALEAPREQPAGSEGYCAICYHPLDRCSHCDVPLPHGQDVSPQRTEGTKS